MSSFEDLSTEEWLAFDAELEHDVATLSPDELPIVRRGDFSYGLQVFEGEDMRSELNAIFIETMQQELPLRTPDDIERFMNISSRAMQAAVEEKDSGVTVGSFLAFRGPGSYMVRENEEAELEPWPLQEGEVLFGSLSGVACGAFPFTEGTDIEQLVDPVRVAQLSRVIGGMLYLECIHVCSQAESQLGRVVRDDLSEVFMPLTTNGLPIYRAYPIEGEPADVTQE